MLTLTMPFLISDLKTISLIRWVIFSIFDKVNKTELSKLVAQKLAKKAQEKKITKIYFDRGSYKYHGRIKVFAETLRENGMEF